METSFSLSLFPSFLPSKFSILHLFQRSKAHGCLHFAALALLHSSRYVSRIKRRGMKLTSLSRDEKERGRLLNGIYSKFGRERSRSMEWHAMAASGILFFSPRGIPRNEKRGEERRGEEGRGGFSRRHLRGAVSFPRVSHMLTSLGFSGLPRGEIRATVH